MKFRIVVCRGLDQRGRGIDSVDVFILYRSRILLICTFKF